MPPNILPEGSVTPPFIKPFLHVLDRLQDQAILRPSQMTERARAYLVDRLEPSQQAIEATFAHGGMSLLANHTHYFDGFAVLLTSPFGTAAAIRETTAHHSSIVFEGLEKMWSFNRSTSSIERANKPVWVLVVEELVLKLAPAHTSIDIAVVSTINAACLDVYLSALGVAVARALQALFAIPHDAQQLLGIVRRVISDCVDMPFSIAFPKAADSGQPGIYTLIDTLTFEQLPLEAPSRDMLGLGIVNLGKESGLDSAFCRRRKEQADEAASILQKKSVLNITSLRDIEHRDLLHVLDILPRRLRRVVRHLVTENRRVQKLVTAIQRRDWQMFGALLLMSYASLQNEWEGTSENADLVVELVEGMSLEGMYGACMTGRGSGVLLAGQPFVVPQCLDRIRALLVDRAGGEPDTFLL